MLCKPRKDFNQSAHPHSIIRNIAARLIKSWLLICPHGARQGLIAPGKDSDQTARMRRLICVLAGCTCLKTHFSRCNSNGIFRFLYLTLKTPRKPASKNLVCLCRLLNILANFSNFFFYFFFFFFFFCIQAISVDPDQTVPRGVV